MVTESIVGAVVLATSALSAGIHMVNHKRISKLEKKEKIHNIEISVLEYSVLTGAGVGIISKYAAKKELQLYKDQIDAKLTNIEATVARCETRVAGTQIETIKAQNELINAKVDHVVNAVDVAILDNEQQ